MAELVMKVGKAMDGGNDAEMVEAVMAPLEINQVEEALRGVGGDRPTPQSLCAIPLFKLTVQALLLRLYRSAFVNRGEPLVFVRITSRLV